jgi:hypothetical protein
VHAKKLGFLSARPAWSHRFAAYRLHSCRMPIVLDAILELRTLKVSRSLLFCGRCNLTCPVPAPGIPPSVMHTSSQLRWGLASLVPCKPATAVGGHGSRPLPWRKPHGVNDQRLPGSSHKVVRGCRLPRGPFVHALGCPKGGTTVTAAVGRAGSSMPAASRMLCKGAQ